MKRTPLVVLLGIITLLVVFSLEFVGEDQVCLVGSGESLGVLEPGLHLINPFADVRKYDLHQQIRLTDDRSLKLKPTPTRQLELNAEIGIHILKESISEIDASYGEDFVERIVVPLLTRELETSLAGVIRPSSVSLDSLAHALKETMTSDLRSVGIEIVALEIFDLKETGSGFAGIKAEGGLKVFILGLDALDWMIVDLVSEKYPLKNMSKLRQEGTWGDLRSIQPLVSPLVWTSIVTGVTPDLHGITDFLAKDPKTGEDIPVTSWMRRVPALWNMCTAAGLKCGFIGWLASYPAEEVNGFVVSDRLAYHMFDPNWREGREVEALAGLTYPPDLISEIKDLIVEPEDVSERLSDYVQGDVNTTKYEFDPNDPIANLRLILSACYTYEGIMKELYPQYEPDLFGIYFEFTDGICHLFMKYVEPPMPDVKPDELRRYRNGVYAAYLDADRIVGEVMDMIDDSTVLIVCSDHGFKSGELRPHSDSRIGHGQAVDWHRPSGAIGLYGKIVKRGYRLTDASVLDIAPTVLYLLGLPVDTKMKGRVLLEAFVDQWTSKHPIRQTSAYDSFFVQEKPTSVDIEESERLRKKLVSLGYVAGGRSSLINLANFYQTSGRYREAVDIWQEVLKDDPNDLGAKIGLAGAYFKLGETDKAMGLLQEVLEVDPRNVKALRNMTTMHINLGEAQKALECAERALKVMPDDGQSHFNRAVAFELLGKEDEAIKEYQEAIRYSPDLSEAYANLAQIRLNRGDVDEAGVLASKAVALGSTRPEPYYVLAMVLEAQHKTEEALSHYLTAARLDSSFVPAYIGACSTLLKRAKLDSVLLLCDKGLKIGSSYSHYLHELKARALYAMGRLEESEGEFRKAIGGEVSSTSARLGLAHLYIAQGKPDRARKELEQVIRIDPTNEDARTLLRQLQRTGLQK